MPIAKRAHTDTTQQVEILLAVSVVEVNAFAALKEHGKALVCGDEQRLLLLLNGSKVGDLLCCRLRRAHQATTSVPQSSEFVKKPDRISTRLAGRMRTRFTPLLMALVQASSFGSMPPLTIACSTIVGMVPTLSQRMTAPASSFTPGTSVRNTSACACSATAQADAISSAFTL